MTADEKKTLLAFGAKVRGLRAKRKLSQQKLAELAESRVPAPRLYRAA